MFVFVVGITYIFFKGNALSKTTSHATSPVVPTGTELLALSPEVFSTYDTAEILVKITKSADQLPSDDKTSIKEIEPTTNYSSKLTKEIFVLKPNTDVFIVPFYSQFKDISASEWKKVGCGIASLAMLIDFYAPNTVSVDKLLQEGINANAYLDDAGWTHSGLIALSKKYGLTGESHDFSGSNMKTAFNTLELVLKDGPVMASVHYTFDPKNPIPHLVVINGVKDNMVYYNDPSELAGGRSISIEKFQNAWKKRYIEIHPV